jgi:hypothetical protein
VNTAARVSTAARQTLTDIRTIQRLESYVRCARAELASNPHDELLCEFIRINEGLIREERERLLSAV